jgi:hypothetical protein
MVLDFGLPGRVINLACVCAHLSGLTCGAVVLVRGGPGVQTGAPCGAAWLQVPRLFFTEVRVLAR